MAGQLVNDPSSAVQRRTIDSVAGWPREQAAPILLAALDQACHATRSEAARQLAAFWPAAADFPVDGPAERRAEVLARLERRLRDEIGRANPEALAAVAVEPSMPSASPQTIAYVERLVTGLSEPGVPELARRQSIALLKSVGPELVAALDADPELAEAFHALTPGRRKSYVLNLNAAKKPETRASRIERFRDRILAGKGTTER